VDAKGRVIGISTFIVSPSGSNAGVGFAVPSNIARTVFDQIRKYGHVRRGQIGVIAQTITPLLSGGLKLSRDWGVIIADVAPRSAAEAGGIETKDIILEMDGKPMENARQFGVGIYQKAGQTVILKVLRGNREMSLEVAVLERPKDPDRIFSLVRGDENVITRLGIVAIDLDERVTPLLPPLRRLSGVVVAGSTGGGSPLDGVFFPGDVIYEVNNTKTANLAELKAALAPLDRGAPVAVLVERGGQLQYVELEAE
jgi:serine protease Do